MTSSATDKPLAGKVALVTGASSGIGEATAVSLARAGAIVAVAARRAERLERLVAEVAAGGGEAFALPGDMTDRAGAAGVVEEVVARRGRIDILVNSAGMMQVGGIEGCDIDEYRRVVEINLFGTLYTCDAAVPHMLAQGSGDIVTISSLAGRKSGPGTNAYSASKHAVNAMTNSMRQELGGRNIRVITVMPGATATEVGDNVSDPAWRKTIQSHVSREGVVLPSEVGDTIAFVLALPQRVNVSEISIRPTNDTTA